MELDFWGIDENLFKQRAKDKIELVQQLIDTPVLKIFDKDENNEFFHKSLADLQKKKFNFAKLIQENQLKFGNDFRIAAIKEFVQIQFGENFERESKIGRVYGINHNSDQTKQYVLYEGEFIHNIENGKEELDGYGRYISDYYFKEGQFKNHVLNGKGQTIDTFGNVEEGQFRDGDLINE